MPPRVKPKRLVFAHPAPASASLGRLADITNRKLPDSGLRATTATAFILWQRFAEPDGVLDRAARRAGRGRIACDTAANDG
jgi:hypothetical protein